MKVFLSSTHKDLQDYRESVHDALTHDTNGTVSCLLSKDWLAGNNSTVEECKRRVLKADGLILLLGHYYGSCPPGCPISITHMEYRWARDDHSKPAIAVMRPEIGSKIDNEWHGLAQPHIPPDPAERDRHELLLKTFHQEAGNWKFVVSFANPIQLCTRSIVVCRTWQEERGELPPPRSQRFRLTPEQLGSLGRSKQLEAVKTILSDPDAPAVAMLVQGSEDSGIAEFLAYLKSTDALNRGRPASIGQPRPGAAGSDLLHWFGAQLGLTGLSLTGPEDLAVAIAGQLKKQHLSLIIENIHRWSGGLAAFASFWDLLSARLRELRAELGLRHRLIVVVSDSSGAAASGVLQALPRLGNFKKQDILEWFQDIHATDDGRGRLKGIAERVLKTPAGKADPVPARVFRRLQDEDLGIKDEFDD